MANQKRQGSGFNPLFFKDFPTANLFRDDAVGLNFEHIFNGAKAQHSISMFTPRQDPCAIGRPKPHQVELWWPARESQWGLDCRLNYKFSEATQIDLEFLATPSTIEPYSQGYIAMMWASYMNRAIDRKIRFWGVDEERVGWVHFGENDGAQPEVGTIAHRDATPLPFEPGAQTLNLVTSPTKAFLTPFYYGLLDGDHDLQATDDRLLYLMLFDQTDSIRFAMWNFIRAHSGNPDMHSPAWDWQYVITKPVAGETYGYRARLLVQPFEDENQIWEEYRRWRSEIGTSIPAPPKSLPD